MTKFTPVGAQQNRWFTMQAVNNQGMSPLVYPLSYIH